MVLLYRVNIRGGCEVEGGRDGAGGRRAEGTGDGSGMCTPPRDALEGKGPQRRPQKRLDRRLEEVAKAVGGGYCRLQMPFEADTWPRTPNPRPGLG